MNKHTFEVKTNAFQGPFDLLLFFIEQKELDIHAVSLSSITGEFLAYLQEMQELNMEVASEFIYVAATLIRIKAKTLLPSVPLQEPEPEVDLQTDLIEKLIVYKQFKEVCSKLQTLQEKRRQRLERGSVLQDLHRAAAPQRGRQELASLDLFKLMKAYDRLIAAHNAGNQQVRHTVVQYPYTIEGQKKALSAWIAINERLDFQFLRDQSESRVHFVYNFLAILEMIQQQLIELNLQEGYNNFSIQAKPC